MLTTNSSLDKLATARGMLTGTNPLAALFPRPEPSPPPPPPVPRPFASLDADAVDDLHAIARGYAI